MNELQDILYQLMAIEQVSLRNGHNCDALAINNQ
jgi:hypothetical protein